MLEATGERLIPERQQAELVHAEHLARYRFAAQLASGRRVLDAACGEGYGTAMLAGAGASSVAGIDLDEATVTHARARYGHDYRRADVAELPFEDDSFDLVVSFETIEHVPDAERALDQFHRVLAPDGLLVISTPNKARYLDENEFHTREFTQEEFLLLLRSRFASVRAFFQENWLVSAILDSEGLAHDDGSRALDAELSKVVARAPGEELYTVAVCGHEGVGGGMRQLAVATGVFEAQELARLYRAWVERAQEAERRIEPAKLELEEAVATIQRIEASVSWRITRPLRSAKAWLGRG